MDIKCRSKSACSINYIAVCQQWLKGHADNIAREI